jgi:hypothetical protein
MKTRSAKNKGKRLQNDVRDLILETFKELEPDDVRSTTMGDSGEDVLLSPAARKLFPFSVECKNQEKLNICYIKLGWMIFSHRCWHLYNHGKWID